MPGGVKYRVRTTWANVSARSAPRLGAARYPEKNGVPAAFDDDAARKIPAAVTDEGAV